MMLAVRCMIVNNAQGRYEWRGWFYDLPQQTESLWTWQPKRRVPLGQWKPPRTAYRTLRSAVRSIDTLARRMQLRVLRISLASYTYDAAGKKTGAAWRTLR